MVILFGIKGMEGYYRVFSIGFIILESEIRWNLLFMEDVGRSSNINSSNFK